MVQELQVLKCCSCSTYQVHIVKKAKKWDCKLCNQKQSIKEVFGKGSGKDCRIHAQKLNALRATREGNTLTDEQFSTFLAASTSNASDGTVQPTGPAPNNVRNKWDRYLDHDDVNDESPEEDNRHLLEGPRFQKKKRKKVFNETNTASKKVCVRPEDSVNNAIEEQMRTTYHENSTQNYNKYQHTNRSFDSRNSNFQENSTDWRYKTENYEVAPSNLVSENPSQQISYTSTTLPSKPPKNTFISPFTSNVKTAAKPSSKWAKYLNEEEENETDIEVYNKPSMVVENQNQETIFETNSKLVSSRSSEENKSVENFEFLSQSISSPPSKPHFPIEPPKTKDSLSFLKNILNQETAFPERSDLGKTGKSLGLTTSLESNENQQSNKPVEKCDSSLFEDPDDALLDQILQDV